jgi:hypothetical protein
MFSIALHYRVATSYAASLIVLLLATVAGCGSSGPPRGAIEGQVTIGGVPLKSGRIMFTPLPPAEGPAASAAIVDGKYRIEQAEGPVVGDHRVAILSEPELGFPIDDDEAYIKNVAGRPLPPSPIPPAYGHNSQVTTTIKEGDGNQFDVAIPTGAHAVARPTY